MKSGKNLSRKSGKNLSKSIEFLKTAASVRWILLLLVMTVFTVILYPNVFFTRYTYKLGDVADRDIKASDDFLVEDRIGTEKKEQEARGTVLTVYDQNALLLTEISRNVEKAFQTVRKVFEETPPEPLPPAEHLPGRTSVPLSEEERESREKDLHEQVMTMQEEFEKLMGFPVSSGAYRILENNRFSKNISDMILRILRDILGNGVVANKELLLREGERGIILRIVGSNEERRENNLRKFYGLDQAKTMVRIIGQPLLKDLNYTLANLIVDFTQQLIQPNITLNRNETEERKKKSLATVKPVFYKIKAGEMLLREGERVTEVQLLKLEALRRQNRQEKRFAKVIGNLSIIFCMLIVIAFLHSRQRGQKVLKSNKEFLFIALMLILCFLFSGISVSLLESLTRNTILNISDSAIFFGIPLASGAMAVCLFMGFDMAASFALIISVCTALIFQARFEVFIYFFISSLMAAFWMQSCRERKVFIRAGFKIALLNMGLATAAVFYMGDISWGKLLWSWPAAFMSGIISGVLTAGIVPLMEMTFAYTTDITLLELANLEQPILRKLLMEAPGTYHHCMVVGSMVEAAAAEIGANPLQAKVCGYYHDIGKIKKPLYFIENQRDGKNRHDKLAPSMSGLILISHVKDGAEMARKYKLGQNISDAIRQHHGTSLISYFYEKARQLKGEDAVKIDDYRYPGPKPQTKEIGLVMLADVVEAASRTLENPTPSRIQGLVRNLMTKIFSDGQLDNCELTLRDLDNISKSYIKILTGIHHHRIEYPEQAGKNGKDRHGNPDNKSSSGGGGKSGQTGAFGADRGKSNASRPEKSGSDAVRADTGGSDKNGKDKTDRPESAQSPGKS